jgi:hypothetical protein
MRYGHKLRVRNMLLDKENITHAKGNIDFRGSPRNRAVTDRCEATSYGSPALKIHGNLLACVPVNKSAEPNSAVFSVDTDLRATLLKSKPEIYYITEHYAAYPTVLVRLSSIGRKELRELLGMAWSLVAAKKPARPLKAKSKAGKRRR